MPSTIAMPDPLLALLVGAAIFAGLLVVFWPSRGVWARWQQIRRLTERVRREDALKHLYKAEASGAPADLHSLAGALQINPASAASLVTALETDELVSLRGSQVTLTSQGRDTALHVIRAHRLWERYLADETGYQETDWHEQAEQREHALTAGELDQLSAHLGHPTHDPHGDPIPAANGSYVAHGGQPLNLLEAGQSGRIVHIEDEPETVYAQLTAEGLYPGMSVRVLENSAQRVRFWANGDEHLLAPLVAAHVTVAERPLNGTSQRLEGEPLNHLPAGESARILEITPRCRGSERRRLLDLGILPGTVITAELSGPFANPRAYLVRGTLIALRSEQARFIQVQRIDPTDHLETPTHSGVLV